MKKIRIGVVGVIRGSAFARDAVAGLGLRLVALCDTCEERLRVAGAELGVATYTDFDSFLEHDMDAVFSLADKLSVLVNGRVIATDTVENIRRNPEVQRAYLGDSHA